MPQKKRIIARRRLTKQKRSRPKRRITALRKKTKGRSAAARVAPFRETAADAPYADNVPIAFWGESSPLKRRQVFVKFRDTVGDLDPLYIPDQIEVELKRRGFDWEGMKRVAGDGAKLNPVYTNPDGVKKLIGR